MCTRRGAWEGLWGVHQEGYLGRMVGMCTRTGIWEGYWDVHQERGFGMCGTASSGQEEFYRDLSCPWLVCGEGRRILFAPPGFKWLLLNHYWRLIVGSICFNFSHGIRVAEGGSQQQRAALPLTPCCCFINAYCSPKVQPTFSAVNASISMHGRVKLT